MWQLYIVVLFLQKQFFRNFGAIVTFAFLGTTLSTFTIGWVGWTELQFIVTISRLHYMQRGKNVRWKYCLSARPEVYNSFWYVRDSGVVSEFLSFSGILFSRHFVGMEQSAFTHLDFVVTDHLLRFLVMLKFTDYWVSLAVCVVILMLTSLTYPSSWLSKVPLRFFVIVLNSK